DRGEAGAVRRERPALHRRGRDPGALVGLGGRGRRRARPRSGRVRLPGDPGGAPGPSGPARPGRPCLRGRPGGEGARARAGRAPGGRPRARRRPARERARARGHDRRDHPREPALPHGRRPAAHRPEVTELRVIPVEGIPEVREGDDLAALLAAAASFEDGDLLVVAQKVVSKAEGRVVALDGVEPSEAAGELAGDEDPRRLEVILREAARIVRSRPPLVIAETRHGFVCASAGVDASNAPERGTLVLLPLDPDASATRIRLGLLERTGRDVGVVVSDSFGRPWRQGTTDVAIGVAGLRPLLDLRGVRDAAGYELHSTTIAVADDIAGAAELVMGKTSDVPAAIVRGLEVAGEGGARELVMPAERDLFR